ncbi:MAG: MFS transporter [Actinobacteria bacterium]|nr:MFS transporter [Actinomycetota bacterium]
MQTDADDGTGAGAPVPRHAVRELFRLPGFRRLLFVRWPAQVADGAFQVGAASLLLFTLNPFEETSAWAIAEVIAVTTLPFTVVGPLAGVLIDRWTRQRVLVWSNVARILVILATLPLASRFALGLDWGQTVFYGGVLLALSVNRFFLTTLGAVLPRVAPGDALVGANAISATGGSVMTLLGAGAGGVLAQVVGEDRGGPEITVLASLVPYGVSALAATRFPRRSLGPELDDGLPPLRHAVGQAARDVVEGVRLTAATRRAWAPIAAFGLLRLSTMVASIAALLVFRNIYGGGPGDIAVVLVWFGVGVFVGAVGVTLLDRTTPVRPETWIRLALAFTGVAIVALAPGLVRANLIVMSALMGVGFGFAKVTADTLVQGALPDRYRGRVFAAYDVIVNLMVTAGGVVAAVTLPRAETAERLYLVAGGLLVATAVLSRRWLGTLPSAVDVETWDEAARALDDDPPGGRPT